MWYMCGVWTTCARTMARVCVRIVVAAAVVVMAYGRLRASPSFAQLWHLQGGGAYPPPTR